jgi:hypothetical protein
MNFGYTKLELFLPKLDQVLKEILKKKEGCRVNKNWAHFYKLGHNHPNFVYPKLIIHNRSHASVHVLAICFLSGDN